MRIAKILAAGLATIAMTAGSGAMAQMGRDDHGRPGGYHADGPRDGDRHDDGRGHGRGHHPRCHVERHHHRAVRVCR